jgi:hypothetical protein
MTLNEGYRHFSYNSPIISLLLLVDFLLPYVTHKFFKLYIFLGEKPGAFYRWVGLCTGFVAVSGEGITIDTYSH